MMSGGIGDLSTMLSVDFSEWSSGFQESNAVLDKFSTHFAGVMDNIANGAKTIGAIATSAAITVGTLGASLSAVGGGGSALLGVSKYLLGIAGIAGNLSTAITNLKSGTSFFQKIVGAIGAIGAAAGITSLALRGVSAAMARMGQDTTRVDALAKSLGRVGLAASVAILGIKATTAAISLMWTVGRVSVTGLTLVFTGLKNAILAVPAGLSMVASGLVQVGSTGLGALRSGAAAVGTFAAHAGEALGEVGQSIASLATGFAFGGVIGGLATAAGLLLASGTSLASLGIAGTAAAAPLMRIREQLAGIGQWLTQIGSGVGKAGLAAIVEIAQRGQRYFDAFLKAVQPLTDAIQNVWLPAVIDSTNGANTAFGAFFDYLETTWGSWISDSISALAEFVANFDVYFQIAQQTIVLWTSNAMLQVSDFFANVGKWLSWFGENWSDALFTVADLAATVFINIGENLKAIFVEIWDWVSSGFTTDINIDWTPLTEGFQSQIKEWPDLVETELATSTPELESLFGQLGERQAAAAQRGQKVTATKAAETDWATPKVERNQSTASNRAALAGSSEAASIMLRGLAGPPPDDKQVAEQKKTNQKLDKLTSEVKNSKPAAPKIID